MVACSRHLVHRLAISIAFPNLVGAVTTLEQAVKEADRYRSRQVQSRFRSYLGEAYGADSQTGKAYDIAHQGLAFAQDVKSPLYFGIAYHALGRITHTRGNLTEAKHCLQEARAAYETSQVRYELARTHLDLASLAHTQGDHDTAITHLSTAYAWFKKLQVPKWVEKTEQLAREYGIALTEVELAELTEEPS